MAKRINISKSFPFAYTEQAQRTSVDMIEQLLVRAKAREISKAYNDAGEVLGLKFTIESEGRLLPFLVTANIEGTLEALKTYRKNHGAKVPLTMMHAGRVAWRNTLEWIRAQLVRVETASAETVEVFFPYLVAPDGRTVYQVAKEHNFKALLPAPQEAIK